QPTLQPTGRCTAWSCRRFINVVRVWTQRGEETGCLHMAHDYVLQTPALMEAGFAHTGDQVCECPSGFQGTRCQYDVNECEKSNGGCEGKCCNTIGSFYCKCPEGSTLGPDDKTCQDVDECDEMNGGCQQNCVNTLGSYYCECGVGFRIHADARTCIAVNSCAVKNGGCEQKCLDLGNEHYRCECRPQYQLKSDGKHCESVIMEFQNAAFRPGYTLASDRRRCDDVDECVSGRTGCAHGCVNTQGSSRCVCNPGFELGVDGKQCYRIEMEIVNGCEKDNGGCAHHCEHTNIGPVCSCNRGYQLADDLRMCIDTDECETEESCCHHDCKNYPGGYECSCKPGYTLGSDGCECKDVNECLLETSGCNHYCINIPGSYECFCREGFRLENNQHTCIPLYESDLEPEEEDDSEVDEQLEVLRLPDLLFRRPPQLLQYTAALHTPYDTDDTHTPYSGHTRSREQRGELTMISKIITVVCVQRKETAVCVQQAGPASPATRDVLRAFSGRSVGGDVTAPIMDAVTVCMEAVSVLLDCMEDFVICRVPGGRSALDVHTTVTVFRRIHSDATARTGRVTANLGTTAAAARQNVVLAFTALIAESIVTVLAVHHVTQKWENVKKNVLLGFMERNANWDTQGTTALKCVLLDFGVLPVPVCASAVTVQCPVRPAVGAVSCHPGYTGERCEHKCPEHSYGPQCECVCVNGVCDHISGACNCNTRLDGDMLGGSTAEPPHPAQVQSDRALTIKPTNAKVLTFQKRPRESREGTYGPDCKKAMPDAQQAATVKTALRCVCGGEGGQCHPVTGRCNCTSGRTGHSCQEVCPRGRYGAQCRGVCACVNGGVCDQLTEPADVDWAAPEHAVRKNVSQAGMELTANRSVCVRIMGHVTALQAPAPVHMDTTVPPANTVRGCV
ncbi:hypothetical protein QTP70_023267, partial [Hemibagrus guttatus]